MERPCPSEEPVIISQSFAFAPVNVTGLMQAKETAYAAQEQHRDEDEIAEAAVGDDQIARLEMVQ